MESYKVLKTQDLFNKPLNELKVMIVQLRRELMNLRFQSALGQTVNSSRYKIARREIAKIKTVISQLKATDMSGVLDA